MSTDLDAVLATVDAMTATLAAVRAQLVALKERERTTSTDEELTDAEGARIPKRVFNAACRKGEIEGARIIGRKYVATRGAVRAWVEQKAKRPNPIAPSAPKSGVQLAAPQNDVARLLARARGAA